MVQIRTMDQENQQPVEIPRAIATARVVARKRRKRRYNRDLTADEKRDMVNIKKKTRRVMTGMRPKFHMVDAGQQLKTFVFGNYEENTTCEMYLPDMNHRNSLLALARNVNGLMDTEDGKQACIFALGILCSVNPHFETELIEPISRLGFNIESIRLPSQAAEYAIDITTVQMMDAASYLAIFGLTMILIFKTATDQNINHFSTVRLNALKAAAGVEPGVIVPNPFSLTKAQSVRAVLGSSLFLKKKIINMVIEMQNGEENVHAVCRYVATILEYNEMSAVMFPFETLITTGSIVLTDTRVLNEMMNLAEALELISESDLPQYFKYLAPPEKVSRLERARFPTLAALGQKLKSDHMKQDSVKQLVGAKGSVNTLADELYKKHMRFLARKQPMTLDALAKQLCQPTGPTILGDDEPTPVDDEDEDEDEDELDE